MITEELLKNLRGQLVGKFKVQPFTIFNDEAIVELLNKQPKTIEELVQVKGFPQGGTRVRKYGRYIIDLFNGVNIVETKAPAFRNMEVF